MAAGPELDEFRGNLGTVTSDIRSLRRDAQTLEADMETAVIAAQGYKDFREFIQIVEDLMERAILKLKLAEKAGPLGPSAKILKATLEKLEPNVEKIRKATEDAKLLNELADLLVEADKVNSNEVIPTLLDAETQLGVVLAGVDEVSDAFDRVDTPSQTPGLPPVPGATGRREGAAEADALFAEVDSFVAPVNTVAADAADGYAAVRALYTGASDKFFAILGLFRVAQFDAIKDAFRGMDEVREVFENLDVPLSVMDASLRPVEPLLEAADEVASFVLDPIYDFLIGLFGLDELFEQAAADLETFFPSPDLFDAFLEIGPDLQTDLLDFEASSFDVPDVTSLALDTFDIFSAFVDGPPLRIATEGDDIVLGSGGDEAFDPRGGDDVVTAGAGNDIIVASAGDDTIRGGEGTDRLAFAGELSEYDFTRDDDSGALIFTHTDVGAHGFNEGSETVTGVEFFDFASETFSRQTLEAAVVGRSLIDGAGSGPDGVRSTDEGELIFLNPGGTLVDGLSLNGLTFNGMNVVYALGGNDRIQGTQGPDFIDAGPGDDVLVPRLGADALQGGPGNDTFQIFNIADSKDDIDLAKGTADVRGGDTTLAGIENVIVQHGGDLVIFGDALGNVLVSGAGRDLLSGRDGRDALFGGAASDILLGGRGIDTLRGGDDSDALVALDTSDNGGAELYDGEGGYDWLIYSTDRDTLDVFDLNKVDGETTDPIGRAMQDSGAVGPVVIRAAAGEVDRLDDAGRVIATDRAVNIEKFVGSDGDDTLFGGYDPARRDTDIDGAGGADVLYSMGARNTLGGKGDDRVIAMRDPETGVLGQSMEGGAGRDTLDLRELDGARWFVDVETDAFGATAVDADFVGNILNAPGSRFTIDAFEEVLLGDGDDFVRWRQNGQFTLRGGDGDDELVLNQASAMELFGDDGDDTLRLFDNGIARGGAGDDTFELNASSGGDELRAEGGTGNDTFLVRQMQGPIDGGAGYDRVIFTLGDVGVTVNLATGTAESEAPPNRSAQIRDTPLSGIEEIVGSDQGDRFTGSGEGDRFVGRGGDDTASGGGGADALYGSDGDDSLSGEGGTTRWQADRGTTRSTAARARTRWITRLPLPAGRRARAWRSSSPPRMWTSPPEPAAAGRSATCCAGSSMSTARRWATS